jgi:adenylyl cyclase-associated protein
VAQGNSVTTGLRKVTDDMKAKNRGDRSGAVPAGTASSPAKPAAAVARGAGAAARGPPRLELEGGRKWVVENQV